LFFFNDTATTEIYTLPLHDALPIFREKLLIGLLDHLVHHARAPQVAQNINRSEEHTSELQSLAYLVCLLLVETKQSLGDRGQAGATQVRPPVMSAACVVR